MRSRYRSYNVCPSLKTTPPAFDIFQTLFQLRICHLKIYNCSDFLQMLHSFFSVDDTASGCNNCMMCLKCRIHTVFYLNEPFGSLFCNDLTKQALLLLLND